MNPGGEPERDDTGLPPVDIEIPDDARELDRDVQAYRRELRALRRSARRSRWHRSLGKDGVVLPLLACCLILALITGTLLTVFTATSGRNLYGSPGSPPSPSATSGSGRLTMVGNQPLPSAEIAEDSAASATSVSQLDEVMLVLVPANCRCDRAFRWLAGVAAKAGVPAYVIYSSETRSEVRYLRGTLGSRLGKSIRLAQETDKPNALSPASYPPGIVREQLAAILVGPYLRATWVSQISPADSQTPLVQVLTGKSA